MKKIIFPLFLYLCILTISSYAQNRTLKVVALGEIVEITAHEREENSDFYVVDIKINNKIVKKFAAKDVLSPEIMGTFNTYQGDHVLYRTDTGSGACAGGGLYVIQFQENPETAKLADIAVSPVLRACLGEYGAFSIGYNNQGQGVFKIAGYALNLELFNLWQKDK